MDERQALLDDRAPTYNASDSDSDSVKKSDDQIQVAVAVVRDEEGGVKKPNVRMAKIVIPLGVGLFLAAMDGTIVASSYASIGSELKQLQNTSWIATGYMLTMTTFQPLYGKLSDIFGRKQCLVFSYLIFAIGCLICGLARNLEELVVGRAVAGLGGGGMTTVVTILVSDFVPLKSRGLWQGILGVIYASGSATGAPLGGLLADGIGWRWAFLGQVPVALLAILLVGTQVKLPPADSGDLKAKLRRIDFAGAFFLVFAIFTFLLGADRGGNVSWTDRYTLTALITSAVLFAFFGFVEMHPAVANEPIAPKRVMINSSHVASFLANFFREACLMALVFFMALWFQAVAGKSASEAGLGLLPGIIGSVCGGVGGGYIMKKSGKYYTLGMITAIMMVIGNAFIVFFTGAYTISVLGATVALFVQCVGSGTGVSTTLVALIANAEPEDQAIVTALSYLFRSLGAIVGVSVGGTLVQGTLRSLLYRRLVGEDVDIDEIVNLVRSSLSAIDSLEPKIRAIVSMSYEEAVETTFYLTFALSVAGLICNFFIKEKHLGGK
ncbi:MFS general substrate transporter [Schizopora paradoxa]|uniref:MFS general substrate transporter n=1 Tax=Schizopora paradoxa TaxID=27342 RepID=A0A0H2RL46_9AGAM|nr:MFS general substrate transporter [Schizopora paradoxa]